MYALARSAPDLAALADAVDVSRGAVVPLAVDYTDVAALRAALAGSLGDQSADAALIYAPGAGEQSLDALRRAASGPVVELVTSAAAQPTPGAEREPFDVAALTPPVRSPVQWWPVVLGWRADRTWHSPAQISAAALQALQARRDVVLGSVRPWADRPQ